MVQGGVLRSGQTNGRLLDLSHARAIPRRAIPCPTRTTTPTSADYYNNGGYTDPTNLLTPVGSFALSPGPYGTYDMGGDVWQWDEAEHLRFVSGFAWRVVVRRPSDYLASSFRIYDYPGAQSYRYRLPSCRA